MPGKRAEGVRMRGIPLHEDLWIAVLSRAKADGITRAEAIRRLAEAYVDGRIDLLDGSGQPGVTPTP